MISHHHTSPQQLGATPTSTYGGSQGYDSESFLLLPEEVRDALIDRYFDIIHNKQQFCFDRPMFDQERKDGLVPEYLLLGMMAIVARFCAHPFYAEVHPHHRAAPLLRRALRLFNNREDFISIHALQAAIVIGFACFVEGVADPGALLSAQATRMAQVMDIPNTLDHDLPRRGLRIRLFWQTLMMDTWNASRHNIPRQLFAGPTMPKPYDDIAERPPLQLPSGIVNGLSEHRQSIWAEVVILNETFAEICQLNEIVVSHPTQRFMIDNRVRALTERLDRWLLDLPTDLHNTEENYRRYAAYDRARLLAVLHLIYHYQCQLLYFPYLGMAKIEATSVTGEYPTLDYITRCKAHSEALSSLMWKINTTSGMECLWSPVNGHLLVVSSTVCLFSLLSERDTHRSTRIRALMEQNFVMLQQFQHYWPGLRYSFGRLRDLHRYCGAVESFKMDRWMWDFLNRYDGPLPPRPGFTASVEGNGEFAGEDLASHSTLRSSLTFK